MNKIRIHFHQYNNSTKQIIILIVEYVIDLENGFESTLPCNRCTQSSNTQHSQKKSRISSLMLQVRSRIIYIPFFLSFISLFICSHCTETSSCTTFCLFPMMLVEQSFDLFHIRKAHVHNRHELIRVLKYH